MATYTIYTFDTLFLQMIATREEKNKSLYQLVYQFLCAREDKKKICNLIFQFAILMISTDRYFYIPHVEKKNTIP